LIYVNLTIFAHIADKMIIIDQPKMAGTCGPFGDYSPYIRSFTIIPETLQREVVMIHPDHIPHDIPIISLYPIIS
jgi:hypothetical protein